MRVLRRRRTARAIALPSRRPAGRVAAVIPGIASVQIAKQLALFVENRPGTLARVCHVLGAAKINIYALATSDTVDHIVVRMVVSRPEDAIRVFEKHGSLVVATEVLMIEGLNKPGALGRIAQALADANINIEYSYCATSPDARKGLLVLRASNPQKALKVLNTGGA